MSSSLQQARMAALAYLYDHISDFPVWVRQLRPPQFEDIAGIMVQWQVPSENQGMLPMDEIEKREVLRIVALCEGNISKAAKRLKMGKTTIYRRLKQWGYSVKNRMLIQQASALYKKPDCRENSARSL